jgi:chorismate mutase
MTDKKTNTDDSLDAVRTSIDALDAQIQALISDRARLAS